MSEKLTEVNFDGLIGPTHHYGGLSSGNIASHKHRWQVSHPREAALQGLAKMKLLADRGLAQALLPPPRRPILSILHRAGFSGSEGKILKEAWQEAPELLSACFSASAMWTANAATVTPACDANDQKTHFTPANLLSMFHRSIEPPATANLLRTIFADTRFFSHHRPLPAGRPFSDEGAANHTRFSANSVDPGIHLFVYGFEPFKEEPPRKYPTRQSLEASCSIARLHQIPPERCIFARQASEAIDAGVFHNDVASVGNENVFLYHEKTFEDPEKVIQELNEKFAEFCGGPLHLRSVSETRVSLAEAVSTYLFNSQLLTLPEGGMLLLAPEECRRSSAVTSVIEEWIADSELPIVEVEYVDIRESMQNGGGPACLRLRVPLRKEEIDSLQGRVLLTSELFTKLETWIHSHYRETLALPDLTDPRLIEENDRAITELSRILKLPEIK